MSREFLSDGLERFYQGGEKEMIFLCWEKQNASELDKRELAKTLAVVIPMLIELNRILFLAGGGIKLESRLIVGNRRGEKHGYIPNKSTETGYC